MTLLKDTFEKFQAFILEKNTAIQNEILKEGQDSVQVRLDVYGNAYYIRLIEMLEKDFPVLSKLLGKEKFAQLAHDYIDAYPSSDFSVNSYSKRFHHFLANNTGLNPHYAEIAKLEWNLNDALFAADASVITLEQLREIPADDWINMTLAFHPSVRVLHFFYNASDFYKAGHLNLDLPEITSFPDGYELIVWRKQRQSYFCPLASLEGWIYSSIVEGKNFGEICEGLCEFLPEDQVGEFAALTLGKWISEEMFSYLDMHSSTKV